MNDIFSNLLGAVSGVKAKVGNFQHLHGFPEDSVPWLSDGLNKLTNQQLFSDAVVLKIILPVNERIYSGVDGGEMFCNDTESEKIANSLKCTL